MSTRRNYLQVFRGFHRFLEVRKAAEIEAVFGVRLACPVDEFNAARHVSDDSPAAEAPPTPERVAAFFEFLKGRIASARKYAPAARDYALFRTLYHACAALIASTSAAGSTPASMAVWNRRSRASASARRFLIASRPFCARLGPSGEATSPVTVWSCWVQKSGHGGDLRVRV